MGFIEDGQDTKEIVMFIKDNVKYDYRAVANDIASRYPELGGVSFLADMAPVSRLPLFCFMDNHDLFLAASETSITLTFRKSTYDKMATMIFDVADAFNEALAPLVRIGYISNMFLPVEKIGRVKKHFLVDNRVDGMIDFNIGWHRRIETKIGTLNCWEKFMTEKTDVDHLVAQYDINTLPSDTFDFELKSIKDLLSIADEYIESRIKEL